MIAAHHRQKHDRLVSRPSPLFEQVHEMGSALRLYAGQRLLNRGIAAFPEAGTPGLHKGLVFDPLFRAECALSGKFLELDLPLLLCRRQKQCLTASEGIRRFRRIKQLWAEHTLNKKQTDGVLKERDAVILGNQVADDLLSQGAQGLLDTILQRA